MKWITTTVYDADNDIKNLFPYFIDAGSVKGKINWNERDKDGKRSISNPDLEFLGDFASVWLNGRGIIDTTARWDYWKCYRFKNAEDAVFFKLKYC